MIISVDELKNYCDDFQDDNAQMLQAKIAGLEERIRAYTNNNFQNRYIRGKFPSENGVLVGVLPNVNVGDTLQVSQSRINDGLYTVASVDGGKITLNKLLFDVDINLVTKIVYPPDIIDGVIQLLQWEKQYSKRIGVKSETISRHTVTYYDQDKNNQVMGYPASLMGFLKPYVKARW